MFLDASLKAFEWFLRMLFSHPTKENSQKYVSRKLPDWRPETRVKSDFFWGVCFDFAMFLKRLEATGIMISPLIDLFSIKWMVKIEKFLKFN